MLCKNPPRQKIKEMNFVEKSHEIVGGLGEGIKYAVDATVGGGRDALFVASMLPDGGKVFCFDVQESAIERSRALLAKNGFADKSEFFNTGHENMAKTLPAELRGKINCFFFNLGWLPNSDKHIATRADTTLEALSAAFDFADKSACVISVCCYKAHEGGMEEFGRVREFLANRAPDCLRFTDEANPLSPELFAVLLGAAKNVKKSV